VSQLSEELGLCSWYGDYLQAGLSGVQIPAGARDYFSLPIDILTGS